MQREPEFSGIAEQAFDELGDEVEVQFSEGYHGLSKLVMPLAVLCAKSGITANMVTASRLVFVFPLYYLLIEGYYVLAFLTYAFGMLLDFFDGRVAQAMEDIGIVRTQEDRDNGAFFDSMGDKLYWVFATVIIAFFANLDKYLSATKLQMITSIVICLVLAEISLGYVRINDYLANRDGNVRKLKAGISGKLKMTLEGVGTGALYLYLVTISQHEFVNRHVTHSLIIKISTGILYTGIALLFLAIPFAWRSYRLKRPKIKK